MASARFLIFCILLCSVISTAAHPLDTWIEFPRPSGADALNSIAYGNGMFVGVGKAGTIVTSANGADWTLESSAVATEFNRVKFANGRFFAFAAFEPRILVSSNGVNWSELPASPHGPIMDIAHGNGLYLGAISGRIDSGFTAISSDLVNWEYRGNPYFRGAINYLTFGEGKFVAHTSGYGTTESYTYSSTDGVTWTGGQSLPNHLMHVGPPTYDNGLFFLTHGGAAMFPDPTNPGLPVPPGEALFLWYSNDGVTGTNALVLPFNRFASPLKSAAAGEHYVFPYGNSIYYTTNLVPVPWDGPHPAPNWVQVPLGITAAETQFSDVAFGNDYFVAVTLGKIFRSNPVAGPAIARIVQQPASLSVNVGGVAAFSVLAQGTGPISYQWRKDGANLSGATNNTLSLANLTAADAGEYDVQVTNPVGTVTSTKAILRVSFADLKRYSGVTLRGSLGEKFKIEYQDKLEGSEQWTFATNVTLTTPEYIWIDLSSADVPNRYYRATLQPE